MLAPGLSADLDIVVSWNFRHIVRRKTKNIVAMVNMRNNFKYIEREFPGDPALQQIHISHYIIFRELKEKGFNLQQYIENYYKQK